MVDKKEVTVIQKLCLREPWFVACIKSGSDVFSIQVVNLFSNHIFNTFLLFFKFYLDTFLVT